MEVEELNDGDVKEDRGGGCGSGGCDGEVVVVVM